MSHDFLAYHRCTPENGCYLNSTILPCDTFYISYTNKGIYDQPKLQPLLRQSSFETCTGDCASSITLVRWEHLHSLNQKTFRTRTVHRHSSKRPTFLIRFAIRLFPAVSKLASKYNHLVLDVSVNAPVSSDEYFIEYSLPADGMPSIGSISNYVLYDTSMEDIQSG